MAKRVTQEHMTLGDWLDLSDDRAIRDRMADDPYSMVYPALLSHFAGIRNLNWDAAVLGLHIVYGWMPTIPKLDAITRWDTTRQLRLAAILTSARCGRVPADDELKECRTFCNNSMVGASKLLHFLQPDEFPIWDSRVAKAFLKQPKADWERVNRVEHWMEYRIAVDGWRSAKPVTARCAELRALGSFLNDVSDTRLIELVMFHKTVPKGSKEVLDS